MRVRISEVDLEILYMVARGKSYKQVACEKKMTLQTVKNRMSNVLKVFGANNMTHLIAVLIASDVLRVPDLYQDLDVEVHEHRYAGRWMNSYRLKDVRV